MKSCTPTEMLQLFQQLSLTPREMKSKEDWGDLATRGVCLKRKGMGFYDLKMGRDFAIFLGGFGGEYYIGLTDEAMNFVDFGKYDTLEDLKIDWELD